MKIPLLFRSLLLSLILGLALAGCESTQSSSDSSKSTQTASGVKGGGYQQDPGLPDDSTMPWSNSYGCYPWDDYPF